MVEITEGNLLIPSSIPGSPLPVQKEYDQNGDFVREWTEETSFNSYFGQTQRKDGNDIYIYNLQDRDIWRFASDGTNFGVFIPISEIPSSIIVAQWDNQDRLIVCYFDTEIANAVRVKRFNTNGTLIDSFGPYPLIDSSVSDSIGCDISPDGRYVYLGAGDYWEPAVGPPYTLFAYTAYRIDLIDDIITPQWIQLISRPDNEGSLAAGAIAVNPMNGDIWAVVATSEPVFVPGFGNSNQEYYYLKRWNSDGTLLSTQQIWANTPPWEHFLAGITRQMGFDGNGTNLWFMQGWSYAHPDPGGGAIVQTFLFSVDTSTNAITTVTDNLGVSSGTWSTTWVYGPRGACQSNLLLVSDDSINERTYLRTGDTNWSLVRELDGGQNAPPQFFCGPPDLRQVYDAPISTYDEETEVESEFLHSSGNYGESWTAVDPAGIGHQVDYDTGHLYALAVNGNQRILSKSTDGGLTWADLYEEPLTGNATHISTRVWAGDGWVWFVVHIAAFPDEIRRLRRVRIDGSDAETIQEWVITGDHGYVGPPWLVGNTPGLKTWYLVNTSLDSHTTQVGEIRIDVNGDAYTVTAIARPTTDSVSVSAVAPLSATRALAVANQVSGDALLYLTTDGGLTWTAGMTIIPSIGSKRRVIRANPSNFNQVAMLGTFPDYWECDDALSDLSFVSKTVPDALGGPWSRLVYTNTCADGGGGGEPIVIIHPGLARYNSDGTFSWFVGTQ